MKEGRKKSVFFFGGSECARVAGGIEIDGFMFMERNEMK